MRPFVVFASSVAFFHLSEFVLASIFMRKDLSKRSWLITTPYTVAMLFACLEYWLELRFCGVIKIRTITKVGLAGVVTGEVVRKTAMITAQHNFTHDVKFEKEQQHVLVTNGIYRYCRHPGYLGWFIWVVGTQLVLVNPVCTLAFTAVAWNFFSQRIPVEETQLQRFFGGTYLSYKAKTPTLIPFIS